MTALQNEASDRKAIQQRLKKLMQEHTQSEIARKTGVLPNKVHRYANGAKIPAEFCAALTRAFGVNPVWMLLGEGVSNVSEVADTVQSSAKDVLDLVQALNAVTRMRLGALAGKRHLDALRELNQALDTYEKLKTELNKRTAPVLEDALQSANKLLVSKELDGASRFVDIARQVSRICEDPELLTKLAGVESRVAYFRDGPTPRTLELQRSLFRRRISGLETVNERFIDDAAAFSSFLYSSGHLHEARRALRTTIALSQDSKELSSPRIYLKNFLGLIQLELGAFSSGQRLVLKNWPKVAKAQQVYAYPAHLRTMVYGGHLKFDVLKMLKHTDQYAIKERIRLSLLSADPDIIRDTLESCTSMLKRVDASNWITAVVVIGASIFGFAEHDADHYLDIFMSPSDRKKGLASISGDYERFRSGAFYALILRMRGQEAEARKICLQSASADTPDKQGRSHDTYIRIIHAKNAEALLSNARSGAARNAYDDATSFLKHTRDKGFACI